MEAGSDPIRILIVDDHPIMRVGIAAIINAQPRMQVVGQAGTAGEAVRIFEAMQPDLTLMDLRLPRTSGIEAITAIRNEFPTARIIVLTTYAGDVQALRAFRSGASGYLLKTMLRTELVDTIRRVHAGQRRVPPEIAAEMAQHAGEDVLSAREIEVLRHVAAGNSNKAIANNLNLSEHTIKGHIKNILSKLGASDRTHAVMIALKRGFLDM